MSDLFQFFKKANSGDFDYVDRMTEDEVKAISPFVLLSWAHGAKTNTEAHVICTDAYMNDKVFSLSKHPRLLLKLFVAANAGFGDTKYSFVKPSKRQSKKDIEAIAWYYNVKYSEAEDYARILSDDDKKQIQEYFTD